MDPTRPYTLQADEGWVLDDGVEFVVKLGERIHGRGLAVLEYTTTEDEWPGHTHHTEDEIFYVLKGSLTFRCGEDTFDVDGGGFVFLPCGIQHGYKIRDGGEARLLVATAPVPTPDSTSGWDGFMSGFEGQTELRASTT